MKNELRPEELENLTEYIIERTWNDVTPPHTTVSQGMCLGLGPEGSCAFFNQLQRMDQSVHEQQNVNLHGYLRNLILLVFQPKDSILPAPLKYALNKEDLYENLKSLTTEHFEIVGAFTEGNYFELNKVLKKNETYLFIGCYTTSPFSGEELEKPWIEFAKLGTFVKLKENEMTLRNVFDLIPEEICVKKGDFTTKFFRVEDAARKLAEELAVKESKLPPGKQSANPIDRAMRIDGIKDLIRDFVGDHKSRRGGRRRSMRKKSTRRRKRRL